MERGGEDKQEKKKRPQLQATADVMVKPPMIELNQLKIKYSLSLPPSFLAPSLSITNPRREIAGAKLPVVVATEFSLNSRFGREDRLAADERNVAGGSGSRRRARTRRHRRPGIGGDIEPTLKLE